MAKAQRISGEGLAHRKLRVADTDVVWLRSIIEAYDGLATLYGDGSGVVILTTTPSQLAELDGLLEDLVHEAALQRL